jgi:peptide deformylase
MPPYVIRIFGDPVLKQQAAPVTDIDGSLARLSEDMVETMRAAPGLGLAAPQVGVMKRLFVYQLPDDDTARVLVNPRPAASGSSRKAACRCRACSSRLSVPTRCT